VGGFIINIILIQPPRSFSFRAFSYSSYIINFPTRDHYPKYDGAQGTRAERNRTGGLLGLK